MVILEFTKSLAPAGETMKIKSSDIKGSAYHLMVQTIVPRPIAWALTKNENTSYNLAPFSYFNGVYGDPPIIMMSIGYKANGQKKDSWVNIEREKDFVIHIPSVEQREQVTWSAYEFENEESEVDELGLELTELDTSRPRLKDCRIAFYCQHIATHLVGERKQGMILAEITEFYIDDAIVSNDNDRIKVDAMKLNPLARLGGSDYASLGEVLTVKRPASKPGV